MTSTLEQFRARAFERSEVRQAYDELDEEFSFLDEALKARAAGRGPGSSSILTPPAAA